MSRFESITIGEVESSDLETFYEHQLDPGAIRMAAFVCEDPKDKVAFDAQSARILVRPRKGRTWCARYNRERNASHRYARQQSARRVPMAGIRWRISDRL